MTQNPIIDEDLPDNTFYVAEENYRNDPNGEKNLVVLLRLADKEIDERIAAWNGWMNQNQQSHLIIKTLEYFRKEQKDNITTYSFRRGSTETDFLFANNSVQFQIITLENQAVDFTNVQFGGNVLFVNASFGRGVRFNGATFTGDATFSGATFTGDAKFNGATFTGYAGFDETTFKGNCRFDGAIFTGNCRFDKSKFTGNFMFDRTVFKEYATFDGATFEGSGRFDKSKFTGDTTFDGAIFTGHVMFDGAKFTGNAEFVGTAFTKDTGFSGTTFTRGVNFYKAIFTGYAMFRGATFIEGTAFCKAKFIGYTSFNIATFEKEVSFNDSTFHNNFSTKNCIFKGDALFQNAKFLGKQATFEGSQFLGKVDMSNITSNSVIDLRNTKIEYGVDFDKSTIGNQNPDENTSTAFRRLKKLAEDSRDHKSSLDFFAKEIRSDYEYALKDKFGTKLGYKIYDFISDFGRNFWQPLKALGIIWFLFANIYFSLIDSAVRYKDFLSYYIKALFVSLSYSLPLYGSATEGGKQALKELFGKTIPLEIYAFGTFQMILSGVFIFLMVLALRNMFRV